MINWIENYFKKLYDLQTNTIVTNEDGVKISLQAGFASYINWVKAIKNNSNKIMFVGNGGSAGIASHVAIDYSKNGGMRSQTFNDSSAITCLSNDYGYEYVFSKQIEYHAKSNDILVAISSSGRSINILNAVSAAKKIGCKIVTFSGFTVENPLSKSGDLNFYVDSKEYGFVEVAHVGLIHSMLDFILVEDHTSQTVADASSLVTEF